MCLETARTNLRVVDGRELKRRKSRPAHARCGGGGGGRRRCRRRRGLVQIQRLAAEMQLVALVEEAVLAKLVELDTARADASETVLRQRKRIQLRSSGRARLQTQTHLRMWMFLWCVVVLMQATLCEANVCDIVV